jgi:membrane-associated phospholipid phosphatase
MPAFRPSSEPSSALDSLVPFLHGIHVRGFDQSYPSGHTLRTALVAATAWRLRPRLAPLLALWLAAAAALLVAGGWHVPSDVAGGLLLAGFLVAAAPRPIAP